MITAENLSYEYPGKRALDNVSFHVPAGSITALVGPNGAGKTTLLRCIAALDEPLGGTIRVDGIDASKHPRKIHHRIGYLSDSFGLYDELTVEQSLMFIARTRQIPENHIAQQIKWAADMLGLNEWLPKKAGTLSRGWRQRLGIAQAIIHHPKLLLLDEPASGLDPEARMTLSALLRDLRDHGMTLLVSSHILAELEDYCTAMLVLRNGCITNQPAPAASGQENSIIEITLLEDAAAYVPLVEAHPCVQQAQTEGKTLRLNCTGTETQRQEILKLLVSGGAPVSGFTVKQSRLQDIYMASGNAESSPPEPKEPSDAPQF